MIILMLEQRSQSKAGHMIITSSSFKQIFLSAAPLVDLRSPCEFAAGTIPGSVNLPLLSDQERHDVGLCYKKNGAVAAVELGKKIVSGNIKLQKMEGWTSFVKHNPNAIFYCFRGGLRSQTVQQWLVDAGVSIPIVEGGYKALRNFLLKTIDEIAPQKKYIVLSGNTGSLKTEILSSLSNKYPVINLEEHANHKGSAFGQNLTPQPTQIDFENRIAIDLLRLENETRPIALEDESKSIGAVSIPNSLFDQKKISPVFLLDISLTERIENTKKIYVENLWKEGFEENQNYESFKKIFAQPLERIKKKLGGENLQRCLDLLDKAINHQLSTQDFSQHTAWIAVLLEYYYDPLYEKGMRNKNVVGKGDVNKFLSLLFNQ